MLESVAILTAATEFRANLMSKEEQARLKLRLPSIMSDAAYVILTKNSRNFTQQFCIDEDVLIEEGVTDFAQYAAPKPSKTRGFKIYKRLLIANSFIQKHAAHTKIYQ